MNEVQRFKRLEYWFQFSVFQPWTDNWKPWTVTRHNYLSWPSCFRHLYWKFKAKMAHRNSNL